MKRLKEILNRQAERASGPRGALVTVVGGYIIYMGLKMPVNTRTGASSMSMPLTVVLTVLMLLVGGLVIAYGGFLFVAGWKKANQANPADSNDESQKGDMES